MTFSPVPQPPPWALAAARDHRRDISRIAVQGLAFAELLGGIFAALAIGAAVIGAVSRNESDRK